MQYEYIVTLKRENETQVDQISTGLCFISICSFIFEQFRTGHFQIFFSLVALVIAVGTVLNWVRIRAGKQGVRFRTWLLIAGLGWIGMPYLQWLSLFFFFLAFMEYQAKYPLELGFSKEGIVINRLFRKKYPWNLFNNILLKDGMLTMDFKNNKIFQREAVDDEDPDAGEDEFNDYCRGQLDKKAAI
jgi:hypothetical protein